MAALGAVLATTFIPLAIKELPGLIQLVQRLFHHPAAITAVAGTDTNPAAIANAKNVVNAQKASTATTLLSTILNDAQKSGMLTGTVPTPEQIAGLVELVFQDLKAKKLLDAPPPAAPGTAVVPAVAPAPVPIVPAPATQPSPASPLAGMVFRVQIIGGA